jgi:hypothetical protein
MPTVKPTRVFLETLMDNYLEALVAHNANGLPLSKKVKRTENTIPLVLGDGLWATASDMPTYKLYVADPQSGQVGLFGFMKENGFPILISSRLKVVKEQITEIEDIVVREGERFFNPEYFKKPRQIFLDALKPGEKVSRAEIMRVTNLYFDALEQDKAEICLFHDECNRIENGTQTTNNPDLFPAVPGRPSLPTDFRGQINSKTFASITSIKPRRLTVVDEERGLSFGTFTFNHKGVIKTVEIPGIGTVELTPNTQRPFTVVIHELFKVQNGKIREIEAVMILLPYGVKDGWVL